MARCAPAVAVLAGLLLSCTVEGKYHGQIKLKSNFYEKTRICKNTPGLSRPQMELCMHKADVVEEAMRGLQEAVKECQHQFDQHRWNCSSLVTRTGNPYSSAIYQKGFRETAFAYAISSAGVVLSVAKACSQGALISCGCDRHKYKVKGVKGQWKLSGCSSDNLHFGLKFSKKFLDSREDGDDIHSEINLHNNNVGRTTVAENMQVKCKCHGLSGSCQQKTCWRVVPDIRVVGKALREKYESAILVQQRNQANRIFKSNSNRKKRKQRSRLKQWTPNKSKQKRGLRSNLLFYEKSPTFCDRDQVLDISGTSGRLCNKTHTSEGSCTVLCCGRGYNFIKQRRTKTCNCKFLWCCTVECQSCTVEEWISTCK